MPEPKRTLRPDPLDTASEHMAELLQRADELLLEWSKFGAGVRAQVDREAQQIGGAVCDAVDQAVRRAAADGTARAISDQLGAQLAAVSAEVAKLETRARAASRAIAEQRRGDRTLLYGLGAAMFVVIALLVALLLRQPETTVVPAPAEPVATPVIVPSPATVPAAQPGPLAPADPAHEERSATEKPAGNSAGDKVDSKADKLGPGATLDKKSERVDAKAAPKAELKAVPPLRVKQGPPIGVRPISQPRS